MIEQEGEMFFFALVSCLELILLEVLAEVLSYMTKAVTLNKPIPSPRCTSTYPGAS